MTHRKRFEKLLDIRAKVQYQIKRKRDKGKRVPWQLNDRLAHIQTCIKKKRKTLLLNHVAGKVCDGCGRPLTDGAEDSTGLCPDCLGSQMCEV